MINFADKFNKSVTKKKCRKKVCVLKMLDILMAFLENAVGFSIDKLDFQTDMSICKVSIYPSFPNKHNFRYISVIKLFNLTCNYPSMGLEKMDCMRTQRHDFVIYKNYRNVDKGASINFWIYV